METPFRGTGMQHLKEANRDWNSDAGPATVAEPTQTSDYTAGCWKSIERRKLRGALFIHLLFVEKVLTCS